MLSHFRVLDELLECLYKPFITHCNREVAEMQDTVERLALEDTAKSIGCTLDSDN